MITIQIEVNGKKYDGFTGANVTSSLRELSRSFTLDAVSNQAEHVPFKREDSCKIFIDGELFLTGFIERITTDGNSTQHKISISGRDKLGDLVDNTFNVINDLKPEVTLKQCLEHAIAHFGIKAKVIDDVGGEFIEFYGHKNWSDGFDGKIAPELKLFSSAEDLIAAEVGGSAIEYCRNLAMKRQSLIVADPESNLVITRATGEEIEAQIIHKKQNNTNNVLSYTFTDDGTGLFGTYINISQASVAAKNDSGAVSAGNIVNSKGSATDASIRATRQMVFTAEVSSSSGEAVNRSEWEMIKRKAQGRNYLCNVDGYRNQTGQLWKVGTIIPVDDEFATQGGLKEKMLVDKVTFTLDKDAGHNTNLRLVPRNTYQIEALINE